MESVQSKWNNSLGNNQAESDTKYSGIESTKHGGVKAGRSDFLRKRLAKGRVYFDSGDYNMVQSNMERRTSEKRSGNKPATISEHRKDCTSTEDTEGKQALRNDEEEEVEDRPKKAIPVCLEPSKAELEQRAIPTPELLFLRRASLHVPLSSSVSASETNLLTICQPNKRRATLSMRDLLDAMPVEAEFVSLGQTLQSDTRIRRGSACNIPSKLTME